MFSTLIYDFYPLIKLFQSPKESDSPGMKNLEGFFANARNKLKQLDKATPEYLEEVRKQPEDEQKKALQEALEKEYQLDQRRFKNEQERQYYFTRFLQGYDIASFSMFDCYGNKNKHTQAEYEQFKADCIRLQEDFNQHKEKYFTDYVAADTEQGAEV